MVSNLDSTYTTTNNASLRKTTHVVANKTKQSARERQKAKSDLHEVVEDESRISVLKFVKCIAAKMYQSSCSS